MEANQYQVAALRTAGSKDMRDLMVNGALGLCGECGEVADHIKKHIYQGHQLDKQVLVNELGDICWYIAIMAEGLGFTLEEVLKKNIEKLFRRYPNGFESDKSVNRHIHSTNHE